MTAQIYDEFSYRDRNLGISAFTGRGIFRPVEFGVIPQMISTGCYRGFICRYAVEGGSLYLRELTIRTDEPGELLGGRPRFDAEKHVHAYENLPDPVPFTGGILVGEGRDGPSRKIDMFMGTMETLGVRLPFRLFDEFHELVFDRGRLVDAADRSGAVGRLSEKIGDDPWSITDDDLATWLESEFCQRDYNDYKYYIYNEL